MPIIKLLSIAALIGSVAWMVYAPDFEPALAIIASVSALLGNYVAERRKRAAFTQKQTVESNGIGIQAGGNISVRNISQNSKKETNAE